MCTKRVALPALLSISHPFSLEKRSDWDQGLSTLGLAPTSSLFCRASTWCFWTVVLEKTLESPLDCKEIQPVHRKGNQSWMFIRRTDAEAEAPIIWPPGAKTWLFWKDPEAGKDWRQEEKVTTENEMVGWYHRLNGHEFEWTLGVGDEQGGLAFCDS